MKRSFKVVKENIMYGIREPVNDHHNEPEGIINDKTYAEVWARYENGTIILIEM